MRAMRRARIHVAVYVDVDAEVYIDVNVDVDADVDVWEPMHEHANAYTPTCLLRSLCAYNCSRVCASASVDCMHMSKHVNGHMYM